MDHSEESERFQVEEWVQSKLAALKPPVEWLPNIDVGTALLRRGRRANSLRKQRTVYAAAALVALGGMVAFPPTRVVAGRCIDACVSGTSTVAKSLGFGTRVAGSVGERRLAPTFVLPDPNGNPVSLAELHGKVVVVNFWATWCGPCKVETPWFVEFSQRFQGRGLVVVGVSMDEDGWRSVSPFLREHRVNYPVVLGDETLAKAYGDVDSLPTTFIIDKAGRIAITHTGLVAKATYEDEFNQLLADKEPNHE